MVRLGLIDAAECLPDIPIDDDLMHERLSALRMNVDRDTHNAWIAYQGDDAIGFAIGGRMELYFSRIPVARLVSIYITPQHRSSFVFMKLFRLYEAWAVGIGAKISYCGIEREDMHEAAVACAVFPRLKYKWAGNTYTRRM